MGRGSVLAFAILLVLVLITYNVRVELVSPEGIRVREIRIVGDKFKISKTKS